MSEEPRHDPGVCLAVLLVACVASGGLTSLVWLLVLRVWRCWA